MHGFVPRFHPPIDCGSLHGDATPDIIMRSSSTADEFDCTSCVHSSSGACPRRRRQRRRYTPAKVRWCLAGGDSPAVFITALVVIPRDCFAACFPGQRVCFECRVSLAALAGSGRLTVRGALDGCVGAGRGCGLVAASRRWRAVGGGGSGCGGGGGVWRRLAGLLGVPVWWRQRRSPLGSLPGRCDSRLVDAGEHPGSCAEVLLRAARRVPARRRASAQSAACWFCRPGRPCLAAVACPAGPPVRCMVVQQARGQAERAAQSSIGPQPAGLAAAGQGGGAWVLRLPCATGAPACPRLSLRHAASIFRWSCSRLVGCRWWQRSTA